MGTHKTWTPNLDPQSGPQSGPPYGPQYGPPGNGVNSFERSKVNIRIDFSWDIWTTRGFVRFFFYSTELLPRRQSTVSIQEESRILRPKPLSYASYAILVASLT